MTEPALLLLAAAGLAPIALAGLRRDRAAAKRREQLLDPIAGLLEGSRIRLAPDRFPILEGRRAGRAVRIELLPDTLVVRRLPQLWLKLTLMTEHGGATSLGALARSTGGEFYSLVHELPDRLAQAENAEAAIIVRAAGNPAADQVRRAAGLFRSLFRDKAVKEAVVTPRGVRLVRQLSEGTRGGHLLRQARFPIAAVEPETVREMLDWADVLAGQLGEVDERPRAAA